MKKSLIEKIQKSERIELEIVYATLPLILKEGFQNLTIREICENAHITTGMFYRHFDSKDEVLIRCFSLRLEELLDEIDGALEGLSLPEQMILLLTEVLKLYQSFGADSIPAFLNPNITAPHNRMLNEKITFLFPEGADAASFCADVQILLNGLLVNWMMGKDTDLVSCGQKLLWKVVPHFL